MTQITSAPVTSVLVANRGEIARRVFATCRRLGIGTVAVFSDADADSPHVAEADAAVRLPGAAPAETYLRGDLVVAAALAAGADAIHPGYGFLSENAAFAEQVRAAGLTWIGPPPESIAMMGSKVESKKLMDAAGVPVLAELDPAAVSEADLPVLVKASAGGGGRGMRIVEQLDRLTDEVAAAQREAASAFGDPTVFCERYLPTGRHIEVQVMADRHGTVWAVGERECSIQRRHQKVVEEAPSPLVERVPGMRERLFEAARLATTAIAYEGAGTVEFLADDRGGFYFLEMNTRLQVEHPVTENTTGLDLVELQLQVAAGGVLPAEPPASQGYSIEVRLYAEDPAHDWRPQSGPVHHIAVPGAVEFDVLTRAGLRLDSGVVDGSVVTTYYDPMLAKVISFAPTRDQAAQILATALQRAEIHGIRTNRDLLVRVLRHPAFRAGETDTSFFDRHGLAELSAPIATPRTEELSALAAALADAAANRAAAVVDHGLPSGWRNVVSAPIRKRYSGAAEHTIEYRLTRNGSLVAEQFPDVLLVESTPAAVVLERDGVRTRFAVRRYDDRVEVDSSAGPVTLIAAPRFVDPATAVAEGSLLAPMPGSIIRVGAAVGDTVRKGRPILWLEAMKMEHAVAAPVDGVVVELPVRAGQQVDVGAVLAVVEAVDVPPTDEEAPE
ncbi:biotin carboxylase N-terminal domain-containing protein [Skermania piniformis]|uniref:Acetyl/propionyl-CoA carboxylase subunit alpha n=1 Tax=Skermania pinensis TaxID=39122 RepID=A0ABX8S9G3_9ACTN|nr:biotin carboxylase N-terminal domain-containing protein [Skermania piniformis]QXQ14489.1 acetyl/propionyl-CoA carboxylase subunit alpha [Skermania piniformis]